MIQRFLPVLLASAALLAATAAHARGPLLTVDGVETRVMALAPKRTLSDLLEKAGVRNREAGVFSNALARRLDLRKISAGQTFILYQTEELKRRGLLRAVAVPVGRNRTVLAYRESGVERVRFGTYPDAEAAELVRSAALEAAGPAHTGKISHGLRNGDTLIQLLVRAGTGHQDANRAARALQKEVDLRRLRAGEPVELEFAERGDAVILESVRLPGRGPDVEVRRDAFGIFRRASDIRAAPGPLPEPMPATASPAPAPGADPTANLAFTTLKRDETLSSVLRDRGMTSADTLRAILAASAEMDIRRVQPGQRFAHAPAEGRIDLFAVDDSRGNALLVERTERGGFTASRIRWSELKDETRRVAGLEPIPEDDLLARLEPGRAEPRRRDGIALIRTRIERGDTLIDRLARTGADKDVARDAVGAYAAVADPDHIEAGQDLVLSRSTGDSPTPGFFLETGDGRGVLVVRGTDDRYHAMPEARETAEARLAEGGPFVPETGVAEAPEEEDDSQVTVAARRNDTLGNMLLKVGADPDDIDKALRAIREVFNPRLLKVDQLVDIKLGGPSAANAATLERVAVRLSPARSVEAVRNGSGYKAKQVERPHRTELVRRSGTIRTSLYQAAVDGRLPMPIFADLVRMYSYDIDFQREIQPGDGFEVMFEAKIYDGEVLENGRILYAAMLLNGERLPLYHHVLESGKRGYFDAEGRTVTKPLMRTPIDGARISSRFGVRRHPISGYNRMHRGTDFAAPRGTPVYAAGDGVVERIGRYGGYGKYVRIRHNSDYKTAYAHLSRFASNLTRGTRVTQGSVIGRVGSTGRSTGPHLHYEVIFRNNRVNPLTIDLPVAEPLNGRDLENFFLARDRMDGEWMKDPLGRAQHVRAQIR